MNTIDWAIGVIWRQFFKLYRPYRKQNQKCIKAQAEHALVSQSTPTPKRGRGWGVEKGEVKEELI